jgi:ABC-type polysaccharide/polyol phosphate export permease
MAPRAESGGLRLVERQRRSRTTTRPGEVGTTSMHATVSAVSTTEGVRVAYRAARPTGFGLIGEGLREVWSRRRLTRYLVQADLKKKGADTILGNLWWVLDPLLQMLVYVVLLTIITKSTKPDYPLFVFGAILPWKWFTSSIGDGITAVTAQEKIIKQVNFPKLVLPFAAVTGGIVNFAFGLIPLVALLVLFYPHRISANLLFLPAVAAVQFVFTIALATALSATNVFYRDVGNLMRHLLRLWFYLSPALYSADQVTNLTEKSRTLNLIFSLNPWSPMFESYHNMSYDGLPPLWEQLGIVLVASLVMCAGAIWVFKRVEPTFAKVL